MPQNRARERMLTISQVEKGLEVGLKTIDVSWGLSSWSRQGNATLNV